MIFCMMFFNIWGYFHLKFHAVILKNEKVIVLLRIAAWICIPYKIIPINKCCFCFFLLIYKVFKENLPIVLYYMVKPEGKTEHFAQL